MAARVAITRTGASLLVLGAVSLLLGCTGSEMDTAGETTTETSEEAAVRKTIAGFYAATERGDGKRACAALTGRNRRELETMDLPRGSPARPCERAIVEEFAGIGAGRITRVRVEGDTAMVTLTELTTREGATGSAELIKMDGAWKVHSY